MIKGECKSNLDEVRNFDWPESFVSVPRIGELVASKGGKVLKVVSITHKVRRVSGEPYVEIELGRLG